VLAILKISDDDLICVASVSPLLSYVNLGNTIITNRSVDILVQQCHNIDLLDLTECVQIDSIQSILDHCQQLRVLDLLHCEKIPVFELQAIAARLPYLTKLDIGHCTQIDDSIIQSLSYSPSLRIINLQDCHNLTSGSVSALCRLSENNWKNYHRTTQISIFSNHPILYAALKGENIPHLKLKSLDHSFKQQ